MKKKILLIGALVALVTVNSHADPPLKPLPPEMKRAFMADVLTFKLIESLEIVMKSGLAIGTKIKESLDLNVFPETTTNDFTVAAEALLRAKATVSEIELPDRKENCTLVVQNFENWLIALGRVLNAIREHNGSSMVAAAKDARTAYNIAYNSMDLVVTGNTLQNLSSDLSQRTP
jgi:hypothetical protein